MNHANHTPMLAGGGPKWSRLDSLKLSKKKKKYRTARITKKKRSGGSPFSIIRKALK